MKICLWYRSFKIPKKLYFAKDSQSWTGSVAFLDYESTIEDENDYSLGKIYLITEQVRLTTRETPFFRVSCEPEMTHLLGLFPDEAILGCC